MRIAPGSASSRFALIDPSPEARLGLGVEANRARALAWLRWGRKQADPEESCDEELGGFLSFMELAAKIDDDVAAEARKT